MTKSLYQARRLLSSTNSPLNTCSKCLLAFRTRTRRHASTAAATSEERVESTIPPTQHASNVGSLPTPEPSPSYLIQAGVILSRPPLLTRPLQPFEKAFYLYQKRLNERLVLPFTRYFYYNKDTPGEVEWKRKITERLTPARDIGVYNPYGKEAWNDEVLVGSRVVEEEEQVEALVKDAESTGAVLGEGEVEVKRQVDRPLPRETEADRLGDVRSLERNLARTLYLIVKGPWGWRFPTSRLVGREDLARAAERILVQTGGVNMNTWVVGNAPVVHHQLHYPQPKPDGPASTSNIASSTASTAPLSKSNSDRLPKISKVAKSTATLIGEKTFLLKARIMAGRVDLTTNKFDLEDYKWLSKEEVQKQVAPQYWNDVRHALVER